MEILLTGAMFDFNSSNGSGVAKKLCLGEVKPPLYARRVKTLPVTRN